MCRVGSARRHLIQHVMWDGIASLSRVKWHLHCWNVIKQKTLTLCALIFFSLPAWRRFVRHMMDFVIFSALSPAALGNELDSDYDNLRVRKCAEIFMMHQIAFSRSFKPLKIIFDKMSEQQRRKAKKNSSPHHIEHSVQCWTWFLPILSALSCVSSFLLLFLEWKFLLRRHSRGVRCGLWDVKGFLCLLFLVRTFAYTICRHVRILYLKIFRCFSLLAELLYVWFFGNREQWRLGGTISDCWTLAEKDDTHTTLN